MAEREGQALERVLSFFMDLLESKNWWGFLDFARVHPTRTIPKFIGCFWLSYQFTFPIDIFDQNLDD